MSSSPDRWRDSATRVVNDPDASEGARLWAGRYLAASYDLNGSPSVSGGPVKPSQGAVRFRPAEGEPFSAVGGMIRTLHRYGFRCGEWARCKAFVADAADGPCWLVEFADGTTDWWRCDDVDGQYEFSPMSERVKRARQEAGLD